MDIFYLWAVLVSVNAEGKYNSSSRSRVIILSLNGSLSWDGMRLSS